MEIRNLRLSRGWSQEQLAEMSGVSSRTIQRIERGGNASLESKKCIAAVFEIDISQLQKDLNMTDKTEAPENIETVENKPNSLSGLQNDKMNDAIERVTEIKRLYIHFGLFAIVSFAMTILLKISRPGGSGLLYLMAIWVALVILHTAYVIFKPSISVVIGNWEKRQVKKQLDK